MISPRLLVDVATARPLALPIATARPAVRRPQEAIAMKRRELLKKGHRSGRPRRQPAGFRWIDAGRPRACQRSRPPGRHRRRRLRHRRSHPLVMDARTGAFRRHTIAAPGEGIALARQYSVVCSFERTRSGAFKAGTHLGRSRATLADRTSPLNSPHPAPPRQRRSFQRLLGGCSEQRARARDRDRAGGEWYGRILNSKLGDGRGEWNWTKSGRRASARIC